METTVSLVQMLDARERRVQHQQELLARYHKPLICFTMNICGPVKDSPLIRRGFARGRQLLRQQFLRAKLTPLYQDAVREVTGCEAFYVLDADPLTIKKFTTDIEDATPLGRLFDMDVIRPDGLKVDREELNLEGRRCLICGGPAKVCSSRRIRTAGKDDGDLDRGPGRAGHRRRGPSGRPRPALRSDHHPEARPCGPA